MIYLIAAKCVTRHSVKKTSNFSGGIGMKSRVYVLIMLLSAFLVLAMPASANTEPAQALLINTKRFSMEAALRMGKAALEKCRREGVQVAVTVVDRSGREQIVLRDTLAMDIAVPISKKKAVTAMAFNSPTSELMQRFSGAYGVPKLDELMISPGGVPIVVAGNILGGIGVSGAPSGLTDEACAKAGLTAILDDLEMN